MPVYLLTSQLAEPAVVQANDTDRAVQVSVVDGVLVTEPSRVELSTTAGPVTLSAVDA